MQYMFIYIVQHGNRYKSICTQGLRMNKVDEEIGYIYFNHSAHKSTQILICHHR